MTASNKAMLQQARDALQDVLKAHRLDDKEASARLTIICAVSDAEQAIAALQAAIDAPEPEPVAHIRQMYIVGLDGELLGVSEKKELRFGCGNDYAHCTPLYTHPPAVREPLTRQALKAVISSVPEPDDDHVGKWVVAVCRAVEAAHGIGVKP